jgi:hypothetical protein
MFFQLLFRRISACSNEMYDVETGFRASDGSGNPFPAFKAGKRLQRTARLTLPSGTRPKIIMHYFSRGKIRISNFHYVS